MGRKLYTTVRYCALAIALTTVTIMVTGCENPYVKQLKDEFGWNEERMLRDGWLKTYAITQPPVYCYHTLADAECYSKPKRDQKHRLINSSYQGDF